MDKEPIKLSQDEVAEISELHAQRQQTVYLLGDNLLKRKALEADEAHYHDTLRKLDRELFGLTNRLKRKYPALPENPQVNYQTGEIA